jgi:hypothetical protein
MAPRRDHPPGGPVKTGLPPRPTYYKQSALSRLGSMGACFRATIFFGGIDGSGLRNDNPDDADGG